MRVAVVDVACCADKADESAMKSLYIDTKCLGVTTISPHVSASSDDSRRNSSLRRVSIQQSQ